MVLDSRELLDSEAPKGMSEMNERDVLDVRGIAIEKGASVRIAATERDDAFVGTLCGVDYRDGVAFTVSVWTGDKVRHVYAERVAVQ